MLSRCCLALSLIASAYAFYLPGSAPRNYVAGDRIPLLVNALTPQIGSKAQLRSVLSYDYYNPAFHFCQPEGGPKRQSESLGSVLFGDRLYTSPFEIKMLQNSTCQLLCTSTIPEKDAKFFNDRIREDYALNWLVDGLPVAEMKRDDKTGDVFYSLGFELGNDAFEPPALHNHYNIYLQYHARENNEYRVVGAIIWPQTISSSGSGEPNCQGTEPQVLREDASNKISYTYSVMWMESTIPWATRWDNYLHVFDPRIHWFSLINSIVIAIFLCVMVATILMRTVNRDIHRYNAIDLAEDVQEDFGWKLVHAEVFRQPRYPILLSVAVGAGAQMAAMAGVTLVFALFGFLSPSNRGSLSTVMIVTWTFFGIVAGYVSSRLYASLAGEYWKRCAFLTATLFPTALFGTLNLLNFFLIGAGSSGAVPFGTMAAIVALWFCISAPLTLFGYAYGLKKGPVSHPVRVNQIPRQIPPSIWYLKPIPSAIMAGVLPFGAAFIELYFVLSSLFGSKAYYAFGFAACTFAVVTLTTATVSVLMTYFALCAEDWRWHWRSFIVGGGSAFWLVFYGLIYWATRLSLDGFASKILYLGYLLMIGLLDFVITGSIGFVATYFFLKRIYSRIRVD